MMANLSGCDVPEVNGFDPAEPSDAREARDEDHVPVGAVQHGGPRRHQTAAEVERGLHMFHEILA